MNVRFHLQKKYEIDRPEMQKMMLFVILNSKVGRTFSVIWILSFTFNILQFFAGCALLSGTDITPQEVCVYYFNKIIILN